MSAVTMSASMAVRCSVARPSAGRADARAAKLGSLSASTSYLALPARPAALAKRQMSARCSAIDNEFPKFEEKAGQRAGGAVALASAMLAAQAVGVDPAHAAEVAQVAAEEAFPLLETLAVYVAIGGFWFVIGPLGVYTILRKRWFSRSKYETWIQFFLVFFFFPGMLLMSFFINLRSDPRETPTRIF